MGMQNDTRAGLMPATRARSPLTRRGGITAAQAAKYRVDAAAAIGAGANPAVINTCLQELLGGQ